MLILFVRTALLVALVTLGIENLIFLDNGTAGS